MKYQQANADELKDKFWHALDHSPFVMLQLDAQPHGAAPMTAQLDEDAHHEIWFFTARDGHLAAGGAASATFASKGHDTFARFAGNLVEETSRERLDKQWSNFVEAWFSGGKDDPNLLMLRMELGEATIWSGDMGLLGVAKMALGMDVRDEMKGSVTETAL